VRGNVLEEKDEVPSEEVPWTRHNCLACSQEIPAAFLQLVVVHSSLRTSSEEKEKKIGRENKKLENQGRVRELTTNTLVLSFKISSMLEENDDKVTSAIL